MKVKRTINQSVFFKTEEVRDILIAHLKTMNNDASKEAAITLGAQGVVLSWLEIQELNVP